MDKYFKRCEVSGWIGVARRERLRGYIKRGVTVKERYVGKHGIGIRYKNHLDASHYYETIRTVTVDKQWFTVTFERERINQPPEQRNLVVLNVRKRNNGYYCKLGDGITGILTNDWKLVESDVWEVLGV